MHDTGLSTAMLIGRCLSTLMVVHQTHFYFPQGVVPLVVSNLQSALTMAPHIPATVHVPPIPPTTQHTGSIPVTSQQDFGQRHLGPSPPRPQQASSGPN